MGNLLLKAIKKERFTVSVRGTSPLVQHAWNDKAREMMRRKHAGVKTKTRAVRDPEAEFEAASYRTEDGGYGIPVSAVKKALISAAHKDLGIEKTLVRKALFIICDDANGVIPIDTDEPVMREDCVRVGAGSTDLRYRPEFRQWSADIEVEFDSELLTPEAIVNLVERAGFGVGVGESRPEKGGEWGRFEVDREVIEAGLAVGAAA